MLTIVGGELVGRFPMMMPVPVELGAGVVSDVLPEVLGIVRLPSDDPDPVDTDAVSVVPEGWGASNPVERVGCEDDGVLG